jgi:cytochrome P450 family 6
MYPPVATLHRRALTDYQLPNGSILPKGTGVVINVLAFQRDPEHFPEPMQFDPDRFTNEVKATRHPFSYIPFGEGMRICIGMRFGLLQTKLGLAMLLKNFKFNVCSKTEIPLKIDTVNMLHTPLGEVFLNIEKC